MRLSIWALLFFLLSIGFFFWSFTLTDPNLYYSTHPIFVAFQNGMWSIGEDQHSQIVTFWYVAMVAAAFGLYVMVLKQRFLPQTHHLLLFAGSMVLFIFSNPALSHDMYNYMFNAKALLLYGQDPHVQSALQIAPQDTWVRFMHNVHTPAPYGYGWTLLSLFPFVLGAGKFITTFLTFKLFMVIGFVLLFLFEKKLLERRKENVTKVDLALFFVNPLVLVETVVNGHNDVWMMVLAFGSFLLLTYTKHVLSLPTIASVVVLLLSSQIKLATILLVPVWVILLLSQVGAHKQGSLRKPIASIGLYWADLSVLFLFIPLLTTRSQQFHPWYLIWSLSFLPFIRSKILRAGLLVFSVTSMLRYVPFLLAQEYSNQILVHSKLITWSAVLFLLLWFVRRVRYRKRT